MAEKAERRFRLGTTSFIFPDFIIPNVRKLGPVFDEIELLVFESIPEEVLPSKQDVEDMRQMAGDLDLTYNIHLPTDISLTAGSARDRQKAADIYLTVLQRFEPLNATTHTLHLDMPDAVKASASNSSLLRQWQEDAADGLEKLLNIGAIPEVISIETLDYPFDRVEPLLNRFGLPVCIDLGHAVKYGYDPVEIFQSHTPNIPLMHLHGVDFSSGRPKDHIRLDRMPETNFKQIRDILDTYTGTVSLEVFSLENLTPSLSFLSQFYLEIPAGIC